MFKVFYNYFRPKKKTLVWSNRDHDIPVRFIELAGVVNGVEYSMVEYEGNFTYVPSHELSYT